MVLCQPVRCSYDARCAASRPSCVCFTQTSRVARSSSMAPIRAASSPKRIYPVCKRQQGSCRCASGHCRWQISGGFGKTRAYLHTNGARPADAGEQALLQTSLSFVTDSPDHPHREYYDGAHEATKTSRSQSSLGSARSSSAGSARHERNTSPSIRGRVGLLPTMIVG